MNERMKKIFDLLHGAGALEEFNAVAEEWVRSTAVEMVAASDDGYLHALRGQMRICVELADGSKAALAEKDAEAKAKRSEEIRGTIG